MGQHLSILIQIYQLLAFFTTKIWEIERSADLLFLFSHIPFSPSSLKVAKLNEGCEFATACGIGHILVVTHKQLTKVQGAQGATGTTIGGIALRGGSCEVTNLKLQNSRNKWT